MKEFDKFDRIRISFHPIISVASSLEHIFYGLLFFVCFFKTSMQKVSGWLKFNVKLDEQKCREWKKLREKLHWNVWNSTGFKVLFFFFVGKKPTSHEKYSFSIFFSPLFPFHKHRIKIASVQLNQNIVIFSSRWRNEIMHIFSYLRSDDDTIEWIVHLNLIYSHSFFSFASRFLVYSSSMPQ